MPNSTIGLVAEKCLAEGRVALSSAEERALRDLFRKEVRKGAFRVPVDGVLDAFCRHVLAGFADRTRTAIVYDFLPYLRQRAIAASRSKRPPLSALVLFATWIEHWTNMVITVARLRRGDEEQDVAEFFADQPRFGDKFTEIGPPLGLPSIPERVRGAVLRVVALRNDFVHYTWRGDLPGKAHRKLANVRTVVRGCRSLLEDLRVYEYRALDAEFDQLSRDLFPRAG